MDNNKIEQKKNSEATNNKRKEQINKQNNNFNNTQTNNQPSQPVNNNPATPANNNDTKSESNNNSNNTQPVIPPVQPITPPEPVITYSCPNGYILEGTKCKMEIDANYVCPNNTHDYANDNIPRDKYCVNLSEGYETEEECPSGYEVMRIIGFGIPDQYKCLPLYDKIFTCDEGYSLNGTKCIKLIDATIN